MPSENVKNAVLAIRSAKLVSESPQEFIVNVEQGNLSLLAAIDNVVSIGDVVPPELCDGPSRAILANSPTAPLAWPQGLDGTGQIITIADTGFDVGNDSVPQHPAFTGRITSFNRGVPNKQYPLSDSTGHGTHVAGCALGNGQLADGTPVQGTAPGAHLAVVSIMNPEYVANPSDKIPRLLDFQPDQVLVQTYKVGSYVHNWSFSQKQGGYSERSRTVDLCLGIYQGVTLCTSAGNAGDESGRIISGGPASKNVITVGASQTTWPIKNRVPDTTKPLQETTRVADFSSPGRRGLFGQIALATPKPDVVAPGVMILSTASRDATFVSGGEAAKSPPGPLYWYSSGTSMASPLVAGCVAVLRQAFFSYHTALVERDPAGIVDYPRSDLFKALLVNSAIELTREAREYQGFGLVNLPAALIPLLPTVPGEATTGFTNGGVSDIGPANRYSYPRAGDPGLRYRSQATVIAKGVATVLQTYRLAVTIAWIDPEETTIQNTLKLTVQQSVTGKTVPDIVGDIANNVIRVVIPSVPLSTEIRFLVEAVRFAKPLSSPQMFSLVYTMTLNT